MRGVYAAIVRHGAYHQPDAVPSAHLPYPLTSAGERQAQHAGEKLASTARHRGWEIDPTIDSSRMLRAWQTAMLISHVLGRSRERAWSVEEFDALAERSVGSLANLTLEEIRDVLRRDPRCPALPDGWRRDRRFKLPVPGAESLEEAGRRAAAHLEARAAELARTSSGPALKVFVGHGGAFRLAAVRLGVLLDEETAALSMFYAEPVFLERTADGAWRHVGGEWKRRTAGDAAPD